MSFSYVMNKMGEGTVGDMRGAGLLMATYMSLGQLRPTECRCGPAARLRPALGWHGPTAAVRTGTRRGRGCGRPPRGARCGRRGGTRPRSAPWRSPRPARSRRRSGRRAARARAGRSRAIAAPAVDRRRGGDDPRLGDVGGRRPERHVRPVDDDRPVGRQHDVVGVEVEVQDVVRRRRTGPAARRRRGRRRARRPAGGAASAHRSAWRPEPPRSALERRSASTRPSRRSITRSTPSASWTAGTGKPCAARWRIAAASSHDLTVTAATLAVAPQHAPAADVEDVGRPAAADQRARFSHRRSRSTPAGRRPTSC